MIRLRVPKLSSRVCPLLGPLHSLLAVVVVLCSGSMTALGQSSPENSFGVQEERDRLRISLHGKPIVDFVFRDDKILRPYFANARLADGLQVTRNHPPIDGVDAVDHDALHPGIWLGFGDISGQDFWRNKAPMEHVRFVTAPTPSEGRLRFATECRLKTSAGEPLCLLTNRFALAARPKGWLLVWDATFLADQRDISFGDQEEMGFGARVATSFAEKNGGTLRSSTGKKTAKHTWGQPADWCDYSGTNGDRSGGIMLLASPRNFRGSWWHNRDYGVFVANPFGREAMRQGPRSSVPVAKGETLRIVFGTLIHDHNEVDAAAEFKVFGELSAADSESPSSRISSATRSDTSPPQPDNGIHRVSPRRGLGFQPVMRASNCR